jgi:hypothetical protein
MSAPPDLRDTILASWASNNRITVRRRIRGGICRLTWGMVFPISSRTRVITGARLSWWRANWGIGSPLP